MANVGIVGIGFMGMIHYLSYQRVRGVKVKAMCEVNTKRLKGDWRDIKGNFGPPGEMMDLSGIDTYEQLDEMLADPKIDLVDICLPPAMHCDAVIKSLKAGKHVFCEKPMALSAAETRKMVAAAEKAGKLLMIGHILPVFPEFDFIYKAAVGGKYGKLLGGHFKRVISDPLWLPDFYKPDRVGGPMLDLHVHDAHYIRLLFGMPTAVTSQGRMRGEVVEYFSSQFEFDDPNLVVTATSGVIGQQGRPFTHGCEVHFEKATIQFDLAVMSNGLESMPFTVIQSGPGGKTGKVTTPKLGSGDPVDAFPIELKAVLKSLKAGKPAPFLSADLARDAITLCHKQTESVKKGRRVKV